MPFSISSFLLGLVSLHCSRIFYRLYPYLRSIQSANKLLLQQNPLSPSSKILISGATDGIGKQLAFHFHKLGYSLVLHGRNQNKLLQMKNQIPNAVIINCDLKQTSAPIQDAISQYNITILINSAGVTRLDTFNSHSNNDIESLIQINVKRPVQIIHKYIKQQTPQNKLFVNISSMTGIGTFPFLSLYGATKSFQHQLLKNINSQNKNNSSCNLHILNVLPWYVSTKMTAYKKSWDTESTQILVEGIIKLIVAKREEGIGTLKHELIYLHLPLFWKYFIDKLKTDYNKILEIRKRRKR